MKTSLWFGFWVVIILALVTDLFANRKAHAISMKEALVWSVVWVLLALVFGGVIYRFMGADAAILYFTGYIIEKSLSVDNLFVFLLIFSYFNVDNRYQHRVLYWGVFGAIVLRIFMIFSGVALLHRFEWLIYLFGGFLIYSGIKLVFEGEGEEKDPTKGMIVKYTKKILPMTDKFHKEHFFIKEGGKWLATPLLLVLVTVELSDVLFALDSIPAIFGISKDPFIILTSNIFAILGLRSLFFLLAGFMDRFHYLKFGLAIVLTFIGVKMVIEKWVTISTVTSLSVVGITLSLCVFFSLLKKPVAN